MVKTPEMYHAAKGTIVTSIEPQPLDTLDTGAPTLVTSVPYCCCSGDMCSGMVTKSLENNMMKLLCLIDPLGLSGAALKSLHY